MAGAEVIHMAPPAKRVPPLMRDLLRWLKTTGEHPLVARSVFHYEFEFIHPFEGKPSSRLQKYRLTKKGQIRLSATGGKL